MPNGLNSRSQELLNRVYGVFGRENVIGVSGHRNNSSTDHGRGDAIDFTVKGMSSRQVAETLYGSGALNDGFDQLIFYNGSSHLHLGTGETTGRQRGQILEATKRNGKTSYVSRKASDLVGKAKSKANSAIQGAIDGFTKSGGNPIAAGAGAIAGVFGIGGDGGGGSLNPFSWFMDYIKETGFFTRAAMVAIGLILIVAALGWLGKNQLPVKAFAGALKGK